MSEKKTQGEAQAHWTIAQLAAILHKPRNSIYDAIAAGQIRAIRCGRTLRIPAVEAQRVIQNGWSIEERV